MTPEPHRRSPADDAERPFGVADLTWIVLFAWAGLMCVVLLMVNNPSTYIAPGLEGFLLTAVAVVSLIITWAASPLAWLLGRGMRRVRPVVLHLLVFGAVGFVAGAVVGAVASSYARASGDDAALAVGAVCAACTVLGRSVAFIARWVADRSRRGRGRGVAP